MAFLKNKKKKIPFIWMTNPLYYPEILESFRILRNKVVTFNKKEKIKIVLISGLGNRVGASTIALNLGYIMAWDLMHKKIVIVDANPLSPSVHIATKLPHAPGILDYVNSYTPLDKILHYTFKYNLQIIPIGNMEGGVLSPFETDRFDFFLDEIREYGDFIIMDAAPILSSAHARIIASKADGVIIVAQANRSTMRSLKMATMLLEGDGARILGSFLNKKKGIIPKWIDPLI